MAQPTIYTSEKPDALFAGGYADYPATTTGKLDAAATGVLVRGTPLKRVGVDTYSPVLAAEDVVHAVLATEVTGEADLQVPVYQKGQFNRNFVAFPKGTTYANFAEKSADFGIYFENSIKSGV